MTSGCEVAAPYIGRMHHGWADQARSLIEGIAAAIRREIEAGMRRYEKLVEEER